MKTALALLFALLPTYASLNAATLTVKVNINPADLGGLSTNAFMTNYVVQVLVSPVAANPANSTYAPFTNYPGSWFTNLTATGVSFVDTNVNPPTPSFFVMRGTNVTNGGLSPFSVPFPWLTSGSQGQLALTR